MATNIIKAPLIRIATRSLSAQAAANPKDSVTSSPEIQYTQLPNKTLVCSQDLGGALSRISVVFRTGSRNETQQNLGITHVIRSLAGFSTRHYTSFGILRNVQQKGGHLTCTGDRELTAFNLIATRDNIESLLTFLASVASAPAFKPWQVKDNIPRLQYEISTLSPQARTIDILHKAAYRTGLGNSLFVKKDHIGEHSHDMLCQFWEQGFTANRASIVGCNVTHQELLDFGQQINFLVNDPPAGNGTYFGGEVRKDKNSYFAHVAIATEGVGLKDLKTALTYSLLQHVYGVTPTIKWGGSPSPLHKAAAAPDAAVTGLNISYSDTGLFGFFISGAATSVGRGVEAAYKVLKSGNVSDADVKRGKALLKTKILSEYENSGVLVDDIGSQALLTPNAPVLVPGPVLAEAVDKITASEVSSAAKKVANGKFSLAGFGNLSQVPYLDQLK